MHHGNELCKTHPDPVKRESLQTIKRELAVNHTNLNTARGSQLIRVLHCELLSTGLTRGYMQGVAS